VRARQDLRKRLVREWQGRGIPRWFEGDGLEPKIGAVVDHFRTRIPEGRKFGVGADLSGNGRGSSITITFRHAKIARDAQNAPVNLAAVILGTEEPEVPAVSTGVPAADLTSHATLAGTVGAAAGPETRGSAS